MPQRELKEMALREEMAAKGNGIENNGGQVYILVRPPGRTGGTY